MQLLNEVLDDVDLEPMWYLPKEFKFVFPDEETSDDAVPVNRIEPVPDNTPVHDQYATMNTLSKLSQIIPGAPTPGNSPERRKLQPRVRKQDHKPLSEQQCASFEKAAFLFSSKQYEAFVAFVVTNTFEPTKHSQLQEMWMNAHYELKKIRSGLRRLTPHQRYRLRKANPTPASISSVRYKANNRHDEEQTRMLKESFKRNRYPSTEETKCIAEECGLDVAQVKTFFKNRRSRKRKEALQE